MSHLHWWAFAWKKWSSSGNQQCELQGITPLVWNSALFSDAWTLHEIIFESHSGVHPHFGELTDNLWKRALVVLKEKGLLIVDQMETEARLELHQGWDGTGGSLESGHPDEIIFYPTQHLKTFQSQPSALIKRVFLCVPLPQEAIFKNAKIWKPCGQ